MIYMGTTKIEPEKTAAEIQRVLAQCGAQQIAIDYANLKITALRWTMSVSGQNQCFILPVRVRPVYELMNRNRQRTDMAQAERTAWRQILRWIQAQLALIETSMVEPAEVFSPYMQVGRDQTLYQRIAESGLKLLAAATDKSEQ